MSDISSEMATEAPPGGFAGAQYNHVATGAELEGILLLDCSFHVEPGCIANRKNWRLSHDRKVISCSADASKRSAAAILQFKFTARDGRKIAARCNAEYAVFYKVPDNSDPEAAKAFCRSVGRFAAYPYFRALVSRFSSEANLNLPMLPTIASTAHIPPKKAKDAPEREKPND